MRLLLRHIFGRHCSGSLLALATTLLLGAWLSPAQAFLVGHPPMFQGSGSAWYCNVACEGTDANGNYYIQAFTILAGLSGNTDCGGDYLSAFCKTKGLYLVAGGEGGGGSYWPLDRALQLVAGLPNGQFQDTTATGTMQFRRNGSNIGAPCQMSKGLAILDTGVLPQAIMRLAVTDTFTALYSGDGIHGGESVGASVYSPDGGTDAADPIAYYNFNFFDNVGFDLSGNNHSGVRNGAALVPGVLSANVIDRALRFTVANGTNEFSVPDHPSLNLMHGATGSAWIRPLGHHDVSDVGCSEGTIFTKAGNYWFQVDSTNSRLELQNEGSGASLAFAIVPGGIPVNQWTHVAFTRSNDTHSVKFFVNGMPIVANQPTLTMDPVYNAGPITFGNYSFEGYGHCEFNGDIDEVKLWNYPLTDAQIAQEYARIATATTLNGEPDLMPNPQPILKKPGWDGRFITANPVITTTGTELTLSRALDVPGRLTIYDVAGRVVQRLDFASSMTRIQWDGRDDHGGRVSAGIYSARVTAGDFVRGVRVVVLP